MSWLVSSSRCFAAAAAVLACACTGGNAGEPGPCQDDALTFRIEVSASPGPLPADTQVSVRHGGVVEQYPEDLQHGVLFCAPAATGSGLVCDVYSGQAAEVTVWATGYLEHVVTLTLERDENDCAVTKQVDVVLVAADAGV